MKKFLAALITALMVFTLCAAEGDIAVSVNGEAVDFDVQPQIVDGNIMVPMRFIFQKLGASVMYDDETETISSYFIGGDGEAVIAIMQIGNPKAFLNTDSFDLAAAPVLSEDRTLVTLDLIENVFGVLASWDENEMAVSIISAAAEAE